MKMIGEKIDYNNGLLTNTRSVRFKDSGLKSVCNKNTPSAGRKGNTDSKKDSIANIKSKTLTVTPPQTFEKYDQPNQFVITLFEKCFRPSTETIKLNSSQSDQIDSRVILMINKTKVEDSNSLSRPKSEGIKIGAKAQRYKQNNKSEPKQVYDFNTLSEKNLKYSSIKHLTPNEKQNMKKTLLKSSPKIFMTKKNSPQFVELSNKLKSFEEDLKKTKKPTVLALDLRPPNVVESEQNVNKNYVSLKNHQLLPKSQPISSQNLLLPLQSQQQQQTYNELCSDDRETICRISRNKVFSNNSPHGLERTKKMVNHSLENKQILLDSYKEIQQQNRQDKATRKLSVDSNIVDFFDGDYLLLPKQQIKYVLNRFKKDKPQRKQQSAASFTAKPASVQHLNASIPEGSCLHSHDRNFRSTNWQVGQLSYREMESVSFDLKESQTLRDTDCGKRLETQHNVDSPVSQGSKSLRNNISIKPKQATGYQSKLRCLDEGAKTIVTKYDSSDKRSIVQQSIILFHGSKDLQPSYSRQPQDFKPSFSRQLLNDYATRYRGSLGVDAYINQSYQQELQANAKNSPYIESNQMGFDKILVSPNQSIYRFKKAYSIRQADNYF